MKGELKIDRQKLGEHFFSFFLWGLLGAFVGSGVTPLLGPVELWRRWVLVFTVAGLAYGFRPSIRGRNGIPMMALAGAVIGWLTGFFIDMWQFSAVGIIAGAGAGAYLGERLQERFKRNTNRSETGRFWG